MQNEKNASPLANNPAMKRRYLRLMAWMVCATVSSVVAALYFLYLSVGSLPIHMVIATVAGVGLSVLLGTGLMLLVFISNASGHDDEIGKE